MKHFRYALEGHTFVIFTDHKTLMFGFQQKSVLVFIFYRTVSTDIRHNVDNDNTVADALSRIEAVSETVGYRTLAEAQRRGSEVQNIMENNLTTFKLQKICLPDFDANLYCDI